MTDDRIGTGGSFPSDCAGRHRASWPDEKWDERDAALDDHTPPAVAALVAWLAETRKAQSDV